MKTVRVYYAGIPVKNNKAEKRDVLKNFHLGVPQGQSIEVETADWQPSDLAVIQGWVHEGSQNSAHLQFRRTVIDSQRSIGKHTLAIDSNLFLYRDPGNSKHYLRYSLDGIFPTTGNYFTDHIDPTRWQKIKSDLGIDLKPWNNNKPNILICLQRNGGWSMQSLDVVEWCNRTISEIRKHSDRRIVVRAHPGDKRAKNYIENIQQGVKISKNKDILDDFAKSCAVVTYNSSPGVAGAIEGVPVFVTDPNPQNSQAFDVCNTSLSRIENPFMPDRKKWIEKISMCHFDYDDLTNGTTWNIIKDYI